MDLGNSKTASADGSKPKENTQKNLVPKEMFLSRLPEPKSTFGPPRTAQLNFQRQDQSALSRRVANKAKGGRRRGKQRNGKENASGCYIAVSIPGHSGLVGHNMELLNFPYGS
jgi:hypothetical protein